MSDAREPDPCAPGVETAEVHTDTVVDDIGDKITDLRTHLSHAHPLPQRWVSTLPPAELAALHRRIHGRAVEPDPSLVEVRLIELWTDPDIRTVTTLPLEEAIRPEDPLVWLPLRIADRTHRSGSPGHVTKGGCRACADIVDAAIRALLELDDTPQRVIARLVAERSELETVIDELVAISTELTAMLDDATPQLLDRLGRLVELARDRFDRAR